MEQKKHGIDLHLLGWICSTIGRPEIPYDLRKLKRLERKCDKGPFDPCLENMPAWLELREGDWSLIGEMPNLQVLEMPVVELDDYSFLSKCAKLRKLSLRGTNFSDCGLLAQLPALSCLSLPARKRLSHLEALNGFAGKLQFDDPTYSDETFPAYVTIPKGTAELPPVGAVAVRYLSFSDLSFKGEAYTGSAITAEAADRLDGLIRAGAVSSLCLSTDTSPENRFFSMDVENGWAAPYYEDLEAGFYCLPLNPKYDSVEEDAPVEIGGQSPIPRKLALDDLNLAADCAACYIRTGKLYPGVAWAKFS